MTDVAYLNTTLDPVMFTPLMHFRITVPMTFEQAERIATDPFAFEKIKADLEERFSDYTPPPLP